VEFIVDAHMMDMDANSYQAQEEIPRERKEAEVPHSLS
jgi:hypothetical protein